MSVEDSDKALVLALQAGEPSALDTLMERHQESLYRFIYRYVGQAEEAQELTQEVFVRVYFKIDQFVPKAKFVTWLYRIATNLCRDRVRSKQYKNNTQTDSLMVTNEEGHESERDLPSSQKNPFEIIEIKEQIGALDQAIQSLSHDLKTVFVLAALEDRSHLECAELLGISAKTVEMRVYHARKFLMKKLETAGFMKR